MHDALLRYLQERRINTDLAQAECNELHFVHNGKPYFAIGFPNVAGGYEVRNPFFKGCIAPKDISHIRQLGEPREKCLVFEGMTDYLSFLTLRMKNCPTMPNLDGQDYVILNSVSNVSKAIDVLHGYERIHCLLDNDEAGRNAYWELAGEFAGRIRNFSQNYNGYKDLNDYLCGKPLSQSAGTDKAGEASPIRKADDAATEKAGAEDVRRGYLQRYGYLPTENAVAYYGICPSRIASNAENSPINQRGRTSLDTPQPTAKVNHQPLFHKLKRRDYYMGYAVLHMEKTGGTDAAMSAHIERTIKPKNADESRTYL